MKRIVKIKAPRIKRPPYYVIAFQHDAFRGLFSFDHIQSFGHSFFSLFSKQQKKADTVYQNHIARLEARSLRAQMNPHFIYNALNSLQSVMLLKGERETNTITSVNDVASETNQDAILALLKRILVKNAANREALKEQ